MGSIPGSRISGQGWCFAHLLFSCLITCGNMLKCNWTELILVKSYHFHDEVMGWGAALTVQKIKSTGRSSPLLRIYIEWVLYIWSRSVNHSMDLGSLLLEFMSFGPGPCSFILPPPGGAFSLLSPSTSSRPTLPPTRKWSPVSFVLFY